ncbi:uncharacterized protein LOC132005059 [Mustela nigripes]|uniref:uncharacterized protein LOC132005059 n=1 Tax=Mustela nigripes TaxID=77151 RepID=UPI002815FE8E|nr:uncharacterized protein LOC132005059 [Mustela nigripes]
MPILQMQKLHIRGLKYHFQSGPATEELCWLRVDQSRRSTSLRPSEDPTSSPSLMLQKRQQAWDVCSLQATVSSVPGGITRSSSPLSYGATPSRSGTVGLNPLLSTHSLLLPLPAAFCSLQTRDCTDLIPALEMSTSGHLQWEALNQPLHLLSSILAEDPPYCSAESRPSLGSFSRFLQAAESHGDRLCPYRTPSGPSISAAGNPGTLWLHCDHSDNPEEPPPLRPADKQLQFHLLPCISLRGLGWKEALQENSRSCILHLVVV